MSCTTNCNNSDSDDDSDKVRKKKRNTKKKYPKNSLPRELIYIPNKDKDWHESWNPKKDDPLDFPHPFSILLASGGRPNLRKTNTVFNIICRQNPPFKKIFLLHCGGNATKEYDDFNVELLTELPEPCDPDVFDQKRKSLLILEDLNFTQMNKNDKRKLDRIFGFSRTHLSCSLITTSQGFFAIPHIVRLMSNVIVVWKTQDQDSMETIRRRVDMKKDVWKHILDKYVIEPHDSLWIDNTKKSPYPLRINGYEIIKINY